MKENTRTLLLKGMKDGVPIMIGYFAVSFTLGIAAKNAGLTPFQAALVSLFNNASAGEFAAFTLIRSGAGYASVALMTLIANARYLLMSFALSQKLEENTGTIKRMILGFDVTDELFGISMMYPGKLDPIYTYGAMLLALPGWSLGTGLGALMGELLPIRIVSALSVGLYGMFIACIIPQAKKDRVVLYLIIACFALSGIVNLMPWFDIIPSGTKVILLTVLIAGAAAVLFPVKEDEDGK